MHPDSPASHPHCSQPARRGQTGHSAGPDLLLGDQRERATRRARGRRACQHGRIPAHRRSQFATCSRLLLRAPPLDPLLSSPRRDPPRPPGVDKHPPLPRPPNLSHPRALNLRITGSMGHLSASATVVVRRTTHFTRRDLPGSSLGSLIKAVRPSFSAGITEATTHRKERSC